MNFTAWEARKHIEASYKAALRKLGRFLTELIGDESDVTTISSVLESYGSSPEFAEWANSLAHTFVTNTLEENARTWRQAARMSGQGEKIRQMLTNELSGPVGRRYLELIDDNAKYIKSIPQDVAQRLVHHVSSKEMTGERASASQVRDYVGEISSWHAKLISRTESAKASSALTQARAEYTGHDWAIWHTSEDGRVRESHRKMNDVMFRFSDKPAPEELVGEKSVGHYGPGEIFNCRCFAEPVIAWEEIEWPMKVYAQGQIITMGKKAFEERFGRFE